MKSLIAGSRIETVDKPCKHLSAKVDISDLLLLLSEFSPIHWLVPFYRNANLLEWPAPRGKLDLYVYVTPKRYANNGVRTTTTVAHAIE